MNKIAKIEAQPTMLVQEPVAANSQQNGIVAAFERMLADPSLSIERFEQAFTFYERVQASQARKAFDAAMAAAKADMPVIVKNRRVIYGEGNKATSYDHEDLGGIAKAIDPILAKNGLSYRFRVSSNNDAPVTVTCVISHVDGHSEETTLSSGRDSSGAKNAIQSIGSTLTYLQRYTLKAALGLAAAKDDDGKTSEKTVDDLAPVSGEQAEVLTALITETNTNIATFLKIAQAESVSDVLAKDYEGLKKLLTAKKGNAK